MCLAEDSFDPDEFDLNEINSKNINWFYVKNQFEKTVDGAGRNKVSIIYDAKRFNMIEMIGSRFPEMNSEGKIESFDG